MLNLTEAELSNLITACSTSEMRKGNIEWQKTLDLLAEKLRRERNRLDAVGVYPIMDDVGAAA